MSKKRIECGIDEAGRGPLAGPLTVAVCMIYNTRRIMHIEQNMRGVKTPYRDSKQLSPEKRNKIYRMMQSAQKEGFLDMHHVHIAPHILDEKGMAASLLIATQKLLAHMQKKYGYTHDDIIVRCDGRLYAPSTYAHRETITKGDTKVLSIALASIVAKVRRDRMMMRLSRIYPEYGFDQHKGYGTKGHYTAIQKFGASKVHRKSFLK